MIDTHFMSKLKAIMSDENSKTQSSVPETVEKKTSNVKELEVTQSKPKEINGPKGLEPTRYGDWESKGRCYDF